MVKPELGTKRVCPETGRKFYDLNRDPIVSPFTGKSYPLSYFEETIAAKVKAKEKEKEEDEEEVEEDVEEVDVESPDVEIVSLDEADEDTTVGSKVTKKAKNDDVPDLDDDDDDVEIDDDDDDTFLADDDDDDDDDVSDIIGVNDDDDDQ
ncbi:uncharacterized protein (TIGR02300 family) [Hoeflea marina]|uniref:Uncharacterized protein (TIGR02300 family) n=1 Tax=Hoeflea marina TaxID=274592 RepID=A0A317PID4_9HYPH|nr:TIGR02300 family protein [Hoeflea marina]PWW00369.1 uncharacterized protein (TIGR02300 family) [Hoeflea marina]